MYSYLLLADDLRNLQKLIFCRDSVNLPGLIKKIMADLLNHNEIQERASQLSGPTVEGKQRRCTSLLKDFTRSRSPVWISWSPPQKSQHITQTEKTPTTKLHLTWQLTMPEA